jgi:hypothetical protein
MTTPDTLARLKAASDELNELAHVVCCLPVAPRDHDTATDAWRRLRKVVAELDGVRGDLGGDMPPAPADCGDTGHIADPVSFDLGGAA